MYDGAVRRYFMNAPIISPVMKWSHPQIMDFRSVVTSDLLHNDDSPLIRSKNVLIHSSSQYQLYTFILIVFLSSRPAEST